MLALLTMLSAPALANGQSTHLWITETAKTHLPSGDLLTLLESQPEALRVGTMFPDGGYAVGHDYGEVAHWEPFQGQFRDWILSHFDDIQSEEAAPFVAFYLGMASHGMADQVFDSMYMERSKVYDADHGWASATESLDTSQDIVFAALTNGQTVSEFELPAILPTLFDASGLEVDMATMESGQAWLEIAVAGVATTSQNAEVVELHTAAFPWGCSHLLDDAVPGAPPMEAKIVAQYWQALWDELNGETVPLEIIGQFPEEGSMGHSSVAEDVEARLSVVFNKGLYEAAVTSKVFHVESTEETFGLDLDLFYWTHSHVVNIAPTTDWTENDWHTLTIGQDIEGTDGRRLTEDFELRFSTEPAPNEVLSDIEDARECGCSGRPDSRPRGIRGILTLAILGLALRKRRTSFPG